MRVKLKYFQSLERHDFWPDRKTTLARFYFAVLEYTAFFTVIIYAFDELLSRAMSALINFFLKKTQKE